MRTRGSIKRLKKQTPKREIKEKREPIKQRTSHAQISVKIWGGLASLAFLGKIETRVYGGKTQEQLARNSETQA